MHRHCRFLARRPAGTFDPAALADDLGERWDITHGYFKRHAACSYTHPVADVLLGLPALRPDDVDSVAVEIHGLGAGLARTTWTSRLSALFSIPFVAATALVHGAVGPAQSSPGALDDPVVCELASRVSVPEAADLTARLPAERPVRLTVRMRDGAEHAGAAPNPIGDADHHPLDAAACSPSCRGGSPTTTPWTRSAASRPASRTPTTVAPLLRELAA